MAKFVNTDKQLILYWQKPRTTMDSYTRVFKTKVNMYKAVCSDIRICRATTKLASKTKGKYYQALLTGTLSDKQE